MNNNIKIRHAQNTDEIFWFALDKHISKTEFHKKIRDKQAYVLNVDNRPIAILRYNLFWDNTPFCAMLYVDKQHQRKGYGKLLMAHWENEMSALGYDWLLISTQIDETAQHFYRKLGYVDCGSLIAPNQATELFMCKNVSPIVYKQFTPNDFNALSLNDFQRRQEVFNCWRNVGGKYTLVPVHYIEDWNLTEKQQLVNDILNTMSNGGLAYGAILDEKIIGFALLDNLHFGSNKQYIDLKEFYVSLPFRRIGIGKKLFELVCQGAKLLGASKLYISAHSAEESISAYKSYGCRFAEEINADLATKEPCNLQLEYLLN